MNWTIKVKAKKDESSRFKKQRILERRNKQLVFAAVCGIALAGIAFGAGYWYAKHGAAH